MVNKTGRSRSSVVARCCLVLLGWPTLVWAQTAPSLPSVAAIQTGPLSLYPTIELRDIGIDSNIFNESNQPKEDFTFTVNPRVVAAVRSAAVRFVGTSSAGFVFYEKYKEEQSINTLVDGRVELTSTRLRPYVSVGRVRTRDRSGFEIDARALRLETNVAAGVDFELTSITSLTASVRHDDFAYGAREQFRGVNLSTQLDHVSQAAAAGIKLSVTPLTRVTIAAEMQRDRFPDSEGRDADSFRLAPMIEFGSGAAITGRASAGFRQFKPLDPRLPEYRGVVASAGVTYSLLGVTRFDVQANRDVLYSFEAAQPYYLAFGGRVSVSQRVAGPFDVIVLGSRQRLSYRILDGLDAEGRIETTTSFGGGVGIHIGEHLSFSLVYERTDRQSTELENRGYHRNRMLGSVNYGL